MKATRIAHAKEVRDDGSIIEIVVWQLPEPLLPCVHCFKCRLYYGSNGVCRVRYDNERGKGDHRHIAGVEQPYSFSSLDALLADFEAVVTNWR